MPYDLTGGAGGESLRPLLFMGVWDDSRRISNAHVPISWDHASLGLLDGGAMCAIILFCCIALGAWAVDWLKYWGWGK